jgi:DNA-binding transcriptional regulator YdaS (Cro superfamily)
MKLSAYIKRFSPRERAEFALAVGTTLGHLNNVAYEQRTASAALTRQIAEVTAREVAEWELRPNDWHLIWPELVTAEQPAPTQQAA